MAANTAQPVGTSYNSPVARTMHRVDHRAARLPLGARLVLPLLASAASLSACVIPVRPEFDDPVPNAAPFIQQANPPELATVTAVPGQNTTFSVVVGDQDLGDTLYLRWIIDYPPYDQTITRHFEVTAGRAEANNPIRGPQRFAPNCFQHSIAPGKRQHKIMLLVADREFASFEDLEALTEKDGRLVKIGWLLDNLECGAGGTTQ